MKTDQSTREDQRVRELASQYAKKGYTVVVPRNSSDVPDFLRGSGYIPDLVVTSPEENLVVEVKTTQSVRLDKELARVSDMVNAQPGWKFLFVLTNPRNEASLVSQSSPNRAANLLKKSLHPALEQSDDLIEASFLLAWAALEAALRAEFEGQSGTAQSKSSHSMIRDAAILGLIDRKDVPSLNRLFAMRNSILHAGSPSVPTRDDLSQLQELVATVLRQGQESGA